MGMVYSAMLPKFSGDRALDACPVKEGFLDQILGWGAGATCPRRACWGVRAHLSRRPAFPWPSGGLVKLFS